MRLFIAINFGQEVKNRLLGLCDDLRAYSERGHFGLPQNLHLTLAFLGECNTNQTKAVQSVLQSTYFDPFDILIDHIGCFKRDFGDIWWAGVAENPTLSHLQRTLTNKLIAAGFELEKRKYTPHITLGREVVTDRQAWKIESFGETVRSIELMQSERVDGALKYSVVYSHKPVNITYRSAQSPDAEALLQTRRSVVLCSNTEKYPRVILEAWAPLINPVTIQKEAEALKDSDRITIVAQSGQQIVGLCTLGVSEGLLKQCYVLSEFAGMGIATKLVQQIETIAKNRGIQLLKLSSSLIALDFYRKQGYTELNRYYYELDHGLQMLCVMMEKCLI